jgi:hypothetical protein
MAKQVKMKYGKKNLLPAKIEPKDENVRISIVMEGDLLDAIKVAAARAGMPYQTFMKDKLRETLLGESGNLDELQPTFNELVRQLNDLALRVEELEDRKKKST